MNTSKVVIAATSSSLYTLMGIDYPQVGGVLMQAPITNAADVYFGENSKEVAFISPGGSANVPVTSLKNVYVKGTASDELIIVAY